DADLDAFAMGFLQLFGNSKQGFKVDSPSLFPGEELTGKFEDDAAAGHWDLAGQRSRDRADSDFKIFGPARDPGPGPPFQRNYSSPSLIRTKRLMEMGPDD